MDIAKAKQQVKDTIEAYLATDERGDLLLAAERQRPIFLIGAPGIGKTAIIAQVASELGIGLVSYSMTHHTRQSALGLPFIVHQSFEGKEYEASEYTMSEIIGSVYDCMRASGVRRGILFLDEINCVSETLYPSMLQFLQFKTFGRHAVPEGWVVVCAGNPPEYNRSVHDFDVVTLDRVKKVTVEPDYDAWRSYATAKGVHPAVLTFLDVKKDRFYVMESTLDGKAFVTARGWDDLSDIIGIYERLGKTVDCDLVSQYVQNDALAREFSAYYELFSKYRDDYRVADILAGASSPEVVERARAAAFDERLSLVGLLLDALILEQAEIMDKTDVLVALRDDLRGLKVKIEQEALDVHEGLKALGERKGGELEMLVASGGASSAKRCRIEGERAMLARYANEVARCEGNGDGHGFAQVEKLFVRDADLSRETAAFEGRLANAYAFIEAAFGDAQEMLVFTTELTQRVVSARYMAQYGSEAYYSHNANMILSDRQRDLRRRIEDIDILDEEEKHETGDR